MRRSRRCHDKVRRLVWILPAAGVILLDMTTLLHSMFRLPCRTLAALALVAAAAAGVQAQESPGTDEPPVVIELFTSQGCASCPPADRVLESLADERDIIAMSLPVDYWDYLGWEDTLALPGHARRQYAYAAARNESMVYTPQMVLNGQMALTGNRAEEVRAAIARARREAPLWGRVALQEDEEGGLDARIEDVPPGDYIVWLVPFLSRHEVEIGRGENAGRTITYVNVPRNWVRLGEWQGGEEIFDLPADIEGLSGADGCAILVQAKRDKGFGPIVAAGKAML